MPDITRALAGEILSGRCAPGTALPTENELGVTYGVSRTVIREALKVLAAKGLVLSRPRIGTIVCEPDNWSLLDPQVMEWHGPSLFDRNLLDAVLETRRALEPLAASLAAERASLREIADLDAAWQSMAAASNDVDRFSVADIEFHRVLYRASHNPVIRQIGVLIDNALKYSFETSNKTVFDRTDALRCHRAVVEALRLRDKHAAAEAATSLIEQAAHDIDLAARKSENR
ncbi:FadR/GntR family transcriptional regulator [Mesorhizobium muleiense]|uniref:FadR/GntR family transcriptional regulator n=1 Tax=Mesorhizobium muleiense TaxID=1004279 RepID=UPI001F3077CB|nr:FadR/GntR family transcriptional regulator [Mesorhizobium muleiense]MCF6112144.1 FadR family transcriptional regulator [Mesorhizobium muleiense]